MNNSPDTDVEVDERINEAFGLTLDEMVAKAPKQLGRLLASEETGAVTSTLDGIRVHLKGVGGNRQQRRAALKTLTPSERKGLQKNTVFLTHQEIDLLTHLAENHEVAYKSIFQSLALKRCAKASDLHGQWLVLTDFGAAVYCNIYGGATVQEARTRRLTRLQWYEDQQRIKRAASQLGTGRESNSSPEIQNFGPSRKEPV